MRLFLAVALLLALAAHPAAAEQPLQPKIVLQALPYGGVEVAAWTQDDRYIITANATSRTVLIWDVATGDIIDRLILPSDNPGSALSARRLLEISVSDDGKTALISGESLNATPDDPEGVVTKLNYALDLTTRTIELRRAPQRSVVRHARNMSGQIAAQMAATPMAAAPDLKTILSSGAALEAIYEHNGEMDKAAANAILPPLPRSHDGSRDLLRTAEGVTIQMVADKSERAFKPDRTVAFNDAQLSEDGALLAMIRKQQDFDTNGTPLVYVDIFEIETGHFYKSITLTGDYDKLVWATPDAFVAMQETLVDDKASDSAWASTKLPPAILVNAISGATEAAIDGRCFLTVAAQMKAAFGAGAGNCRKGADQSLPLQRFEINAGVWKDFGALKLAPGQTIEHVAVSPDAAYVGVLTRASDTYLELLVLNAESGEIIARIAPDTVAYVAKLVMNNDGSVYLSGDGRSYLWYSDLGKDGWIEMPLPSVLTKMVESNGRVIAAAGLTDDTVALWDSEEDKVLPPLDFASVLAGGFLPDRPLFWAFSPLEGLRFWNSDDWSELMTVHFFANQGYLAVMPEGRYDTNLGPDAAGFRWLVPDRPWQSLSAQTFMRDYFQPGMIERVMTCSYFGDCADEFAPLPPIAELNRVLPIVRITNVRAGDTPDQAYVSIEVTEGVDPQAPEGKQKSGVFNPRLFRDFRFAAQTPNSDFELDQSITRWREVNRMADDDDAPNDGIYHFDAVVYLPTARGSEQQILSVYAFNEDRIKSDTAYYLYTRPKMVANKPRAFVISIGIDNYAQRRLKLNYAAADAELIAGKLADLPGYTMHQVVAAAPQGGKQSVSADSIRYMLSLLSGNIDRGEALKALRKAGIDASKLEIARPDDLVIITFSGHGWTRQQDDFYLLAADAKWPDDDDEPDISTLISSSELTMWLRGINAADIALIIDACHSGASVDSATFKPGPLGDAGLGQLAYDKGIRILAATQGDDVAMENDKLRHGLLTFALAGDGEGLARTDGLVDLDGNGQIDLSEWLAYPTWRLMDFNDDERLDTGSAPVEEESGFVFPRRSPVKIDKVQKPSLFDFGAPSRAVLKDKVP